MNVVFIGPSRPPGLSDCEDYTLREPARCGDIAKAVVGGASMIGLVDGVFESSRSVWHKEILWALASGIPVLGAASMGALRAAELHDFGMIGVGEVFASFRDGVLEDDDEVAVVHGPAELHHAPLSDAMVNIRATLAAARQLGLVDEVGHRVLVDAAKRFHYKTRTFEHAIDEAVRDGGLCEASAAALRAWVLEHAIDIKKHDALELLRRMGEGRPADFKRPSFVESYFWHGFKTEMNLS